MWQRYKKSSILGTLFRLKPPLPTYEDAYRAPNQDSTLGTLPHSCFILPPNDAAILCRLQLSAEVKRV